MSTRAVHIKVLESMDSSSFINFVVACKELQMEVHGYLSDNRCKWIFYPPYSSHMGGSWERLIGMAMCILDLTLLKVGPAKLTHEVLTTFMAEVSAILNTSTGSCVHKPRFSIHPDTSDSSHVKDQCPTSS